MIINEVYARGAIGGLAIFGLSALVACSPGANTLDPSVSSGITTAYNDMCGPTGVVVSAAPFSAANPNIAKYLSEAQAICANGAPTNEIVAGFDIFDVYLDLSQALSAKGAVAPSVVKKAKALKLGAHRS